MENNSLPEQVDFLISRMSIRHPAFYVIAAVMDDAYKEALQNAVNNAATMDAKTAYTSVNQTVAETTAAFLKSSYPDIYKRLYQ